MSASVALSTRAQKALKAAVAVGGWLPPAAGGAGTGPVRSCLDRVPPRSPTRRPPPSPGAVSWCRFCGRARADFNSGMPRTVAFIAADVRRKRGSQAQVPVMWRWVRAQLAHMAASAPAAVSDHPHTTSRADRCRVAPARPGPTHWRRSERVCPVSFASPP